MEKELKWIVWNWKGSVVSLSNLLPLIVIGNGKIMGIIISILLILQVRNEINCCDIFSFFNQSE
jgi:hypothetical protein